MRWNALMAAVFFALVGISVLTFSSQAVEPNEFKDLNPCAAKVLKNPCAVKALNPCAAKVLNPCCAKKIENNPCLAKQVSNPCAAKAPNCGVK